MKTLGCQAITWNSTVASLTVGHTDETELSDRPVAVAGCQGSPEREVGQLWKMFPDQGSLSALPRSGNHNDGVFADLIEYRH